MSPAEHPRSGSASTHGPPAAVDSPAAVGAGSARATNAGPVRTCVGCRRKADWSLLARVTAGPDGKLVIGRHVQGRGAWLCVGSPACVERAAKRRSLDRALKVRVPLAEARRAGAVLSGLGGTAGEGRQRQVGNGRED
ncbi:MAG: YlxR family protein [Acidimicrobiales bacterium]